MYYTYVEGGRRVLMVTGCSATHDNVESCRYHIYDTNLVNHTHSFLAHGIWWIDYHNTHYGKDSSVVSCSPNTTIKYIIKNKPDEYVICYTTSPHSYNYDKKWQTNFKRQWTKLAQIKARALSRAILWSGYMHTERKNERPILNIPIISYVVPKGQAE